MAQYPESYENRYVTFLDILGFQEHVEASLSADGAGSLHKLMWTAGMTEAADSGKPIVVAEPDSPAATEFKKFAERVKVAVGGKKVALPVVSG